MTKEEFFQKREGLKAEMVNLQGAEFDAKQRELDSLIRDFQAETAMMQRESMVVKNEKTANEWMREQIKNCRDGKQREIYLSGDTNSLENGGAIPQNIHDVLETLNEGMGLPIGCELVGGVVGNDIWPTSVNDASMEERGENVALSDQSLDFDKVTCTPKVAGVAIDVSNAAIDNASFDLAQFVINKIALAKKNYLAKKVLSQAAFSGVKGPFSGLTAAGTITIGTTAYAAILKAVAAFVNKGFTGEPCLVIDAVTEAELKACPKAEGQGGFVIENGKLAGYNYIVSHYINTTLDSNSKLVATSDRYLGIGYWNYLAVQQHGAERLTKDDTSAGVAKYNKTNFTYNSEFSVTDLSVKLNAKGGTTTQAFAIYKLA